MGGAGPFGFGMGASALVPPGESVRAQCGSSLCTDPIKFIHLSAMMAASQWDFVLHAAGRGPTGARASHRPRSHERWQVWRQLRRNASRHLAALRCCKSSSDGLQRGVARGVPRPELLDESRVLFRLASSHKISEPRVEVAGQRQPRLLRAKGGVAKGGPPIGARESPAARPWPTAIACAFSRELTHVRAAGLWPGGILIAHTCAEETKWMSLTAVAPTSAVIGIERSSTDGGG